MSFKNKMQVINLLKLKVMVGNTGNRNTVKPVLSGHSKIDKTKVLKTGASLVQVKSIEIMALYFRNIQKSGRDEWVGVLIAGWKTFFF